MENLEFRAFVAWLRSQPEGALVGVVGDCYTGPLARWLESMTGERWLVSWVADSYRLVDALNWRALPLWAGLFYYRLEGRLAEGTEVAREVALAVLAEIEAEWSEDCYW